MERFLAILIVLSIFLMGIAGCEWNKDKNTEGNTNNDQNTTDLPEAASRIMSELQEDLQPDVRENYTDYVPEH